MPKQLIGRFYYKKTSSGNLIGEFSNNSDNTIYTEGAHLITASAGFCGDYSSTWQENGQTRLASLIIRPKAGANDKIFTVEWKENNVLVYQGEAMLCDDILIGDYIGI